MYYCPGCDEIKCGSCVGASQEVIFASQGDPDYCIRWACIECNTYVFELDPIVSTALAIGLPIPIEEEKWKDDSDPAVGDVRVSGRNNESS
jgi:hypothetical protein